MTKKQIIIASSIMFLFGMLLYAYYNEWIIIRHPNSSYTTETPHMIRAEKKTITLFYWHNDTWQKETITALISSDISTTITYITNSWLTVLDEEGVTDRNVSLQTVIPTNNNQDVYISFDRSPFNPESSTFAKWMWIEGLLKTLRDNKITIQRVYFLEHHQPLHDTHLDFSNPWPIQGFALS